MKLPDAYKFLLLEICRGLQITAENAADFHQDKEQYQLKQDFQRIEDKLENEELLNANDIHLLRIGSVICQMLQQKQLDRIMLSLRGYKEILGPKFEKIINEKITDEQAIAVIFSLDE